VKEASKMLHHNIIIFFFHRSVLDTSFERQEFVIIKFGLRNPMISPSIHPLVRPRLSRASTPKRASNLKEPRTIVLPSPEEFPL
jgi:hypothetical protein